MASEECEEPARDEGGDPGRAIITQPGVGDHFVGVVPLGPMTTPGPGHLDPIAHISDIVGQENYRKINCSFFAKPPRPGARLGL